MQFLKTSMLALILSNAPLACMEIEVYSPSAYSPEEFIFEFLKLDAGSQTKASVVLRSRVVVGSSLVGQIINADRAARIWRCVEEADKDYLDNSPAQKFLKRSGLMTAQAVTTSALSTYLSSLQQAVEGMPFDNEHVSEEMAGKEVKGERKFNATRRQQNRLSAGKQGTTITVSIPSSDFF
jgi:hypothetical protein